MVTVCTFLAYGSIALYGVVATSYRTTLSKTPRTRWLLHSLILVYLVRILLELLPDELLYAREVVEADAEGHILLLCDGHR